MAPINPNLPINDPGRTLGLSRGRQSERADQSLSVLFDATAKGVGDVVNVIDLGIQREISKEIQGVKDRVQEPFLPDATSDVPPEVKESETRLGTLKVAKEQRRISETKYLAEVLGEVKRIRQRFPGYREQIDNITKRELGTDPANAIVRKVFADQKTATSRAQAQAVRDENFLRRVSLSGDDHWNLIPQIQAGKKTINDLTHAISSFKEKEIFKVTKDKLTDIDEKSVDRQVRTKVTVGWSQAESNELKALGLTQVENFNDVILSMARGGTPSPQAQADMIQAANRILAAKEVELSRIRTLYGGRGGKGFEEMEELLAREKALWARATANKDTLPSIAAIQTFRAAADREQTLNDFRRKILRDSGRKALMYFDMSEHAPKRFELLFKNREADADMLKRDLGPSYDAMAAASYGNMSLVDSLKQYQEDAEVNGVPNRVQDKTKGRIIEGLIGIIGEDLENSERHALKLYPTDKPAFNGIDTGSWETSYRKKISPSSIESMKPALKASKDTAGVVARGIKKEFRALYLQDLATIKEAAELDRDLKVTLNGEGLLVVGSRGEDPTGGLSGLIGESQQPAAVDRALGSINRNIRQTVSALDATGFKAPNGSTSGVALLEAIAASGNGALAAEGGGPGIIDTFLEGVESVAEVGGQLVGGASTELGLDPVGNKFIEDMKTMGGDFARAAEAISNAGLAADADIRSVLSQAVQSVTAGGAPEGPAIGSEGGDPEFRSDFTETDVSEFLLSLFPVAGEAIAIKDAAKALNAGDFTGAAVAGLGAIPGVGIVGRLAKKGMGLFAAKTVEQTVMKGLTASVRLENIGNKAHADEITRAVSRYANEVEILADKGRKASPEMVNAVSISKERVETGIRGAEAQLRDKVLPFTPPIGPGNRGSAEVLRLVPEKDVLKTVDADLKTLSQNFKKAIKDSNKIFENNSKVNRRITTEQREKVFAMQDEIEDLAGDPAGTISNETKKLLRSKLKELDEFREGLGFIL